MKDIVVFIECKNGSVRKAAFELLSKAKEMAESVCAVALGHEMNSIAEELKPFADKIIVVDHEDLKDYRWDAYTDILSEIIKTYTPFMVFGSSTITGKDLFPRLSARLDMPLRQAPFEFAIAVAAPDAGRKRGASDDVDGYSSG